MTEKQNKYTTGNREIRVFVSSTFRDMRAEREELAKYIFPRLRKLCEERGVTWGEVDLRWGITSEQKAEGRVLPICLEEIRKCRPYFIGILGERYGWVPDEIPEQLREEQPWLAEHLKSSVTELEIIHGVLRDPAMADHAFFYFRDPGYLESLTPGKRIDFTEQPTSEEIDKYGREEAEHRVEYRRKKLDSLKTRIIESGLPVREDYDSPEEFGEFVLRDLLEVIEEKFPEEETPGRLERDRMDHEAFALSRRDVYIGRQEYFDRLDRYAEGGEDGPGLVILGESGSGKSALLANWVSRLRSIRPDDLVIMHFIGATPYSTDWAAMLRRVMEELKVRFDMEGDVPDDPAEIRSSFANWLSMASVRGRAVIVLDALNQLEDREGARELVWLPPVIPGNIRMILSTLEGVSLDELKKRDLTRFTIQPLEDRERRELIEIYLKKLYGKHLGEKRVKRISEAPQCSNPLFLQTLLEELRLFGSHELLEERIDKYLGADGVSRLYEMILERYEGDYEREREGLVGDVMRLLWSARRGLSERELLDMLGEGDETLPQAYWSPLYIAAGKSLVSRSGLIGFAHEYLRDAVESRYLPEKEQQRGDHLKIAGYFSEQELGRRKIDELPWQLAEAGEWKRLVELLTEPDFFAAAWKADQYEVKGYWVKIESESKLRMVDAYGHVLKDPKDYHDIVWYIAFLLNDTGHPEEALKLRGYLVEYYSDTGDMDGYSAAIGNQANIHYSRGELDQAMKLYKEEERICRELGNKDGLGRSLGNQANIHYSRGELDQAMKLYKEEERICRELGNKNGLQASPGNQANIHYSRGELDQAMKLHKEKERICRELGNKNGLQASLGNQALILKAWGQLDEAMKLHKEKERICRELGNKNGLQVSLGNQANIHYSRGELDQAMKLHKEKERICRELGNKNSLQISLGNQALILKAWGQLDEAMKLLKETERICRELGNKNGLQASLGNQALILESWGQLDEAMKLHKEKERICRDLGNKDGLQRTLGNQANIHYSRGELDQAMKLYKEQERICRELGNKESQSHF